MLSSALQGYAEEQNTKVESHVYHNTKRGDWFTRLRALYIDPNSSSGSVSSIPHSGVSVHPAWTGEFDFGYMFTKNLGSELILATSRHTLVGKKSLSGTKIGTTWVLPPTLMLQWRFFPSKIAQPYVGVGVNYTLFYSEHCSLPSTHLKLKHSWGPAVQGGIDIFAFRDWFVNVDVKYIWMSTHARLTGAVNGHVHVDINPWVIGFGFGRKW
jgi:outer membrane protein